LYINKAQINILYPSGSGLQQTVKLEDKLMKLELWSFSPVATASNITTNRSIDQLIQFIG